MSRLDAVAIKTSFYYELKLKRTLSAAVWSRAASKPLCTGPGSIPPDCILGHRGARGQPQNSVRVPGGREHLTGGCREGVQHKNDHIHLILLYHYTLDKIVNLYLSNNDVILIIFQYVLYKYNASYPLFNS